MDLFVTYDLVAFLYGLLSIAVWPVCWLHVK